MKTVSSNGYEFIYIPVGKDNPFSVNIWDIRSFTLTMVSTTSNKEVAALYNMNRSDSGRKYKSQVVQNRTKLKTDLRYVHDGKKIDGAVFKSRRMEEKWDIYVFDEVFYFVRSWTGELIYIARSSIQSDAIIINEIEYNKNTEMLDSPNFIRDSVDFLIRSHLFNEMVPNSVPKQLFDDPYKIAIWSFTSYGNKSYAATTESISNLKTTTKK